MLGEGNSLTEQEIAEKDGYENFIKENYNRFPVKILAVEDVLMPIFEKMSSGSCIVIKIDVGGYEMKIVELISNILPDHIKATIIFENFSASLCEKDLKNWFARRSVTVSKLVSNVGDRYMLFKIVKLLFGKRKYFLRSSPSDLLGNVVIDVDGVRG